jgi:hypothetical protein
MENLHQSDLAVRQALNRYSVQPNGSSTKLAAGFLKL